MSDEFYLPSWSVSQFFPKMPSQSSYQNNYEKPNHVNFDGKQTMPPFSPLKAIKGEIQYVGKHGQVLIFTRIITLQFQISLNQL